MQRFGWSAVNLSRGWSMVSVPYPINVTVVRPKPMQEAVAKALTADSHCITPALKGDFSSHCCP